MKMRIFLLLLVPCAAAQVWGAAEKAPQKDAGQAIRNVMVGIGAGCAEVLVDQPLVYFKNQIQQNQPIRWPKWSLLWVKSNNVQRVIVQNITNFAKDAVKTVRVWYSGGLTNASLLAPQTAVQLGVAGVLPADTKVLNAFVAGAVSGVFSPGELAIIHQQNFKKQNVHKNGLQVLSYLAEKYGYLSLARGMVPMAIRDAGFAGFCFGFQDYLKEYAKQYTNSQAALAFVPGIVTGLASAVATHPFDTIKTQMQANIHDPSYSSMVKTALRIYNPDEASNTAAKSTDGLAALYKGVGPRGFRILSANIVMGISAEKLRTFLE